MDPRLFAGAPCVLGRAVVVVAGHDPTPASLTCRLWSGRFQEPEDRGINTAVGRIEPRDDRLVPKACAETADPIAQREHVWLVEATQPRLQHRLVPKASRLVNHSLSVPSQGRRGLSSKSPSI